MTEENPMLIHTASITENKKKNYDRYIVFTPKQGAIGVVWIETCNDITTLVECQKLSNYLEFEYQNQKELDKKDKSVKNPPQISTLGTGI